MNDRTPDNAKADLVNALQDLTDKLARYTGPLPSVARLHFYFHSSATRRDQAAVDSVDTLATSLFGHPGNDLGDDGLHKHSADKTDRGLAVLVYTYIPAPADEDPAALRAQITALKAQLDAELGERA